MEDLVIYTTSQTHSLGAKAGLVLGLSVRALEVKSQDEFALRGEILQAALDDDEKQGKRPFILSEFHIRLVPSMLRHHLVATVGSTSSGAIDNLPEIRQTCGSNLVTLCYVWYLTCVCLSVKSRAPLWVHVDAAWAGVALSCPEYREKCYLNEINDFAHSFCTNFHKVCILSVRSMHSSSMNSGVL
jgi:aromatic-L-amino-acid decarboxylase